MTSSKDEMRRQLNNAYIETKLNNIIEPMVKDMLHEQPSDHVSLTRSLYADCFIFDNLNITLSRLTS
jgi:hypothetical protein